jgi:tRNA-modifying protein YgfZ
MKADDNRRMTDDPPTAVTPPLEGVARLSHLGLIRAQGIDAASFLHSQLTTDFMQLDAGHARLAGYCSAKGRLLASFVAWKTAPDEVLLACSAEVLPATLKRLSMFVLRAKCKLADASGDLALYGLVGDAATRWLGDGAPSEAWRKRDVGRAQAIRLPDAEGVARYLWAAPADEPAPALPSLSLASWLWLDVHTGVPLIVGATTEQFVPQMVNLELVGGVNFQKGCYPGQEVVARSQYRGTVKRRSFLFESEAPALPGQEVFAEDDPSQPAGMVVNAASLVGHGHVALVELKLAALVGAGLHVGAADGPKLQRATLPYAVPTDAG